MEKEEVTCAHHLLSMVDSELFASSCIVEVWDDNEMTVQKGFLQYRMCQPKLFLTE